LAWGCPIATGLKQPEVESTAPFGTITGMAVVTIVPEKNLVRLA
jgi:hypothetical protein